MNGNSNQTVSLNEGNSWINSEKSKDEFVLQQKNITKTNKKVKFAASKKSVIKLWIVLLITLAFSGTLLAAAHISHSLTLRVEAYHALYNLLSLIGCLLTMKLCSEGDNLKNTFGWARVELLSTLCTLLFLGSLCFGVAVDSMQTAAHAGHQDSMHHPITIIALAGIGLCVNIIVFFLIGGYTHYQGCLLERKNSIVWIKEPTFNTSSNGLITNEADIKTKSCQGIRGTLRDISGLIIVMICATIVLWDEGQTLALYVDPAFAVFSAVLLLFLSYPYGKECCHILLQTIPGHIDVQSFSGRFLRKFPEIVNVHHLQIWSLTPGKVVATAHVVFNTPSVYKRISKDILKFFNEEEISKVTIQPEFVYLMENISDSKNGSCQCLLQCRSTVCENVNNCPGCNEVTSNNRNTEEIAKINISEDSSQILQRKPFRQRSESIPNVDSPVTNKLLINSDIKTNSYTCIMMNEDYIYKQPINTLQNKLEKSNFHSLQDISSNTQVYNSGKIAEYLSTFQELK